MEQFFTSLTKRQTMLLLTTLTFGGSDSVGAFDHLTDAEGELLRHRAEELLKIPREKRIPVLVQEIKRLVTARRGQVWSADPERLAHVLKHERPALIEVVLRALPIGTAEAVRRFLPKDFKGAKLTREVKPQVLNIIRWKMEEGLARASAGRPSFKFSDVLLLKSREVLTVCDRLGARALAQAIAGLSDADREAFFARLPPDQRQSAMKRVAAVAGRGLTEEDAHTLLNLHGADRGAADALRSAGAQRLARASLAQSTEFAARLVERHPGALGQLLLRWVREERQRMSGRMDGGRTDVVQELERLERQGIIDKPVRLPPPPMAQMQAKAQAEARAQEASKPRPAAKPQAGPLVAPVPPPGGKLVPPRPRVPLPPGAKLQERPAAPSGRRPLPSGGVYRDAIADRDARRAGASAPAPERPEEGRVRRDPIAERAARRAGAAPLRPEPAAEAPRRSPEPGAAPRRPGSGTPGSGGRGPRGGSR